MEETKLENVQNCENQNSCGRTDILCGRTKSKNLAVSLCGRTEETCGRRQPESDQTEKNVVPLTIPKVKLKPLPLRYEYLGADKTKLVVTSETDKMKDLKKGDQVWFSKTKLMNLVEKLKLKCRRKFKANWSEPFKITTTYPTGGMEVWSVKTGSFKVKTKFIKHFLPDKFVKAGHGEVLPNNQTT
jgi:hypothetical protein